MEFEELTKSGDYLILVRGRRFLSRGIQFFMRLYALRFNRVWRKAVNHSDFMTSGIVTGAKAKGIVVDPWHKYYKSPVTLFVYKVDASKSRKEVFEIIKKYEGIPYDVKNFIDFIWKFISGRWTGHTGRFAKEKLYCIEHTSIILEEIGVENTLVNFWDNDPEELRQWAIDNLDYVGKYEVKNNTIVKVCS